MNVTRMARQGWILAAFQPRLGPGHLHHPQIWATFFELPERLHGAHHSCEVLTEPVESNVESTQTIVLIHLPTTDIFFIVLTWRGLLDL